MMPEVGYRNARNVSYLQTPGLIGLQTAFFLGPANFYLPISQVVFDAQTQQAEQISIMKKL